MMGEAATESFNRRIPEAPTRFAVVSAPDPAQRAAEVLRAEADAILAVARRLDAELNAADAESAVKPDMDSAAVSPVEPCGVSCYPLATALRRAVKRLVRCTGRVVVTGVGKAGHIGAKLSATLASTGTPSFFLHPAEAVHGDLGRLGTGDLVLALSQSGETEELVRLLPFFESQKIPVIALTGRRESHLGRASQVVLETGIIEEACRHNLAPTSSTAVMLALGDALAMVVSEEREFGHIDFAQFHPGGNLGRRLAKVDDFARPMEQCRIADDRISIREVFATHVIPGRRSGAIMLTGADGTLSGIFTDSDLARLFERRQESQLDAPIGSVMTRSPQTVLCGEPIRAAIDRMASRRISELPVVDMAGHPVGMIDVTDLVAAFPKEFSMSATTTGE